MSVILAGMGVLVFYIIYLLRMITRREIIFFGFPIALYLIVLGLNELWETWDEFPQYILLCGTVFTGFIAMYISKTSEARDKKSKQENRKIQLDNIQEMLTQGLSEISQQLVNYDRIKKKINEYPFKDQPFEMGSFYFISEITKLNKERIFDYFVHSNLGTIGERREKYIRLIKNVNDANFIYDLFEKNKKEFVRNHNIQSKVLRGVEQNFEDTCKEVFVVSQHNNAIMPYYGLLNRVVENCNTIRNSDHDYQYSIEFYRRELIGQLNDIISKNPNHFFKPKLRDVINKYASVINKVEDNVENFSITIDVCTQKLESIGDRLRTIFPD